MTTHRSGFIALIGEANAGKSTLLNAVLGRKISIVTAKPHTTRHRILGIKRRPEAELVFVDTPGFPAVGGRSRVLRGELGRHLSRTLQDAAAEVDLRVLVVDATRLAKKEASPDSARRAGQSLLASLRERHLDTPDVLVLNKVDLVRKDLLLPIIRQLHEVFTAERAGEPFDVVPISAKSGDGVDGLVRLLSTLLPEGEPLFPSDIETDQSETFFASEIIREKLFHNLHEELPQGIAVQIENWNDEGDRLFIDALVTVERESHKPMVLGKGGQMIKKIGESARLELKSRFDVDVVLKLHVRVEENWSRSARGLDRTGYGEEV